MSENRAPVMGETFPITDAQVRAGVKWEEIVQFFDLPGLELISVPQQAEVPEQAIFTTSHIYNQPRKSK